MTTNEIALHGSVCEADGHPTDCQEVVAGETQDLDGDVSVTINGVPVTDHGDVMHFDNHAHDYRDVDGDDSPECTDFAEHDLVPDENPAVTINGRPIVRVGDSTSDPGAGMATVVDSGGNDGVTHSE